MLFNRKNVFVMIDGQHLFVNEAQLNSSVDLSPQYLEGQRHSFDYSPGRVNGSLRLTYFITGQDILKNKLSDEAVGISGFINGLYFTSGYITSYNASFQPNQPIQASAEISFFNCLTGEFYQSSTKSPNLKALNASDAVFSNLTSNTPLGNIYSASYEYSASVEPHFYENTGLGLMDIFPDRVIFGEKMVKLTIESDSTTGYLPIYGSQSAIRISAKSDDGVEMEAFSVSGKINERGFNFNNNTKQQIQIIQNRISDLPQITTFYPTAANASDNISIEGSNFKNVLNVYVNNEPASSFTVVNENKITFPLSPNLNSGYIRVETFEENATSNSKINISYPDIDVDSFFPDVVESGNSVLINGNNFYKISDVLFNDTRATSFQVVNANYINAVVPGRILNGPLKVISSSRNKSGSSSFDYAAYPVIDSFSPKTGFIADTILMYGANFTGIQSVKVNNINALYTGTTTGLISLTIPAGNTNGYIKITTDVGLEINSPYKFEPVISITGVSIKSGIAHTPISISGKNFYDYLLYPTTDELGATYYKASFNGINTGLYLVNSTLLTGRVPRGANTGPIYIYKTDGVSTYSVTGGFTYINDSPEISLSIPSGIVSGDSLSMYLIGTNLLNLNKVYLSGHNTGTASGFGIIVWDKNYTIINPPPDTSRTRRLNTSGQNDLFGLASTFKHILNTNISLSGNSMLTGLAVRSGLYNLIVENVGGTGYVTGSTTIYPLTNLSQIDSTRLYLSSTPSDPMNQYGVESFTDNNTGTYGMTDSLPKSFVKCGFTSTCQIFEININTGPYTYPSMTTGYLEISLITGNPTGLITGIASSGICTGLAYSRIRTGFVLNTGTASWRHEANAILIRSHRINGGGEINYPLALSNVEIYGIKMNRTGAF